jgi:hypothetical protein
MRLHGSGRDGRRWQCEGWWRGSMYLEAPRPCSLGQPWLTQIEYAFVAGGKIDAFMDAALMDF